MGGGFLERREKIRKIKMEILKVDRFVKPKKTERERERDKN